MSFKRYIPIQDAFIVSGSVGDEMNTGGDEILELGKCNVPGTEGSSRILMSFDLNRIRSEYPSASAAILHLSLADASNLPSEYSISVSTVTESWEEGTDKIAEQGSLGFSGVTWVYRNSVGAEWTYPGAISGSSSVIATQSFDKFSSKDINVDISSILASSENYARVCIRLTDETLAEQNETRICYYSEDTHTIYRPYLEVAKEDAKYSGSAPVVSLGTGVNVTAANLRSTYKPKESVTVRLKVGPQFPTRVFSTTSLYQSNYRLPEASYWGIVDVYTTEVIVPYSKYTRISSDNRGSYFNLGMNFLEPDRYYRLIILSEDTEGNRLEFSTDNFFKVIRDGE